ncbi:MAG: gliding motility-associated ABC transporter substrate-binding protein GldG [Bacteroidales bacterium]|jgi:gliding-associated putative ABC transporter substrate-binding component GldG|nr:gliding motility-associated ABC transporter substrate-binding protein GldG [Bacteroidales bacterium]
MESSSTNIRMRTWIQFLYVSGLIIAFAVVISFLKVRIDLTEDKRYTLSGSTTEILSEIDNELYIQVFLDGEMPIPFKRLRRSVEDMLEEFRNASGNKLDYDFINPSGGNSREEREALYQSLTGKGLNPVNIQAGDEEGGSSQRIIFPGMIVNYNGVEVPVNFLKNNPLISAEENLLHSIEGLEYEMIHTVAVITSDTIRKVAFLEGHGEYSEVEVADITLNLAKYFTIDRGVIGGMPGILDQYSALIIAGPAREFDESDKFVIDQYIMNGGKVIWLLEEVNVNADSLIYGETAALYRPLNIEDQLFWYGARINPVIIRDLDCMIIRLAVMTGGTRQQFVPVPWVYFPLLSPSPDHPITRNLNKVKGEYVNFIDTVGLDAAVKKTVLLTTSRYTQSVSPPLLISLREAEATPDERDYNRSNLPVAILLEGTFQSAFRNRLPDQLYGRTSSPVRSESKETKMIVIADGDITRNEVRRAGTSEAPYPLGQDKYTGEVFGNRDFMINCLNYLIDNNGIMELRSRELKSRLLDKPRIKREKLRWQAVNVLFPVLFVILSGIAYSYFRKRKFTRC